MTAPTPERRVGEDSVKRYATRTLASVATESEMVIQKLARDLLDERAANVRLTAEVERLTNRVEELEFEVCGPVPDDDPVRPLGEWLAERLDDDIWRAAERHLDQVRASFASLTAEVERLRGLVEAAYREGYHDGPGDQSEPDHDWTLSNTRAALSLPTPAPEARK